MAANIWNDLEELKHNVQQKFTELRASLEMREKLLLRQLDVIATSQQQMGRGGRSAIYAADEEKEVKFLVEQEDELLASIRSFGRYQLDNMNLTLHDIYLKNEDYIAPSNDHETMYKCLQQSTFEDEVGEALEDDEEPSETIVVDFSKNKSLIEHNAKNINESIINITLQEAKELIKKAKIKRETPIPPLNLEEFDDELESSIAEAVSSLGRESPAAPNTKSSQTCEDAEQGASKKSKKNRFKPKITINNCNGTINLRNISSLTINCATEDAVNAEMPLKSQENDQDEAVDATSTTNTTTSSQYTKTTQKPKIATFGIDSKNTNNVSPSAIVTVESTSTGKTTPTTTASSSNYSSNSSSRSQSKKQKIVNKKLQKTKTDIAATSTTTSSGSIAHQQQQQLPTTTSTNAKTYPYEIADDDEDHDANVVTCDFYNRLLNEIKNSLKEKSKRTFDTTQFIVSSSSTTGARSAPSATAHSTSGGAHTNSSATTAATRASSTQPSQSPTGKRLVLKNFENLKIILEANSDEESFPVQIEQWLAEIVSETDLEPMQNTDILEHSKIHNESA